MKLFLLFAYATNAASPDSLATLDTANQNLASTKGNFQKVEITGNSRRDTLKFQFWCTKISVRLFFIEFSYIFWVGLCLKIVIRWIKMFLVSFNRQDNCWNLFQLQWRWNSCWMCRQWKYLQSRSYKKFSRRSHRTPNRLHHRAHM